MELLAGLKNRYLLIAKLRHKVAGQNSHRFGSKAEGIDQLQLRPDDEEVARAATASAEAQNQSDESVTAAASSTRVMRSACL